MCSLRNVARKQASGIVAGQPVVTAIVLIRICGLVFQDALLAKEEAKIQRKRELYEQRRVRILNAKVRLIGLDVQALNSQVEEKQRQRETEKEEDRYASKIFSISFQRLLLALT